MQLKKAVFIVPGYRHQAKDEAYIKIARIFKSEGYSPIPIDISWEDTIRQNTKYFLNEYRKISSKKKYILGFSFGAMIAFIAATKVRAAGVILCSLSPYFKEDYKKPKKRFSDFLNLRSSSLAKKIKSKKILMLYGSKESKCLISRVNETFGNINKEKYLFSVKDSGHDIGAYRYLRKIRQVTKRLDN